MKGVSQIKPRLGQGRTGIKWKINFPVPPLPDRPIIQLKEKSISQQPQNLVQAKITLKYQKVLKFMTNLPWYIKIHIHFPFFHHISMLTSLHDCT